MTIRQMRLSDYDDVYSLWLATPGMGLNNLDDSRDGIAKYLERNPDTCFVAEEDGIIIGVILSGHDGRRGFIHHTAVARDNQRQGIGGALVDAAMSSLKNEGINKVALVVFEQNEKGNAFWEKQGFAIRPNLIYRAKAIADIIRMDT